MKATKIDEIFTVDLTLCSKCQIDGEDFINFCGLLRKHKLYQNILYLMTCNQKINSELQPTPLLTRIRFTQISQTRLFKRNSHSSLNKYIL